MALSLQQQFEAEQARRAMIIYNRRLAEEDYRNNPERWYVERFGGNLTDLKWSAYPEYSNHTWDGDADPFLKMFRSLADWKSCGIESATSTGKTFMAARVAYWFLDAFPDSLVVTTAPKEKQLKSILWAEMSACFSRFRKLRPKAEMFDLRVLPDGSKIKFGSKMALPGSDDDEFGDLHQALGIVAGVRAGEESATKMQGFHRKFMLFIIEECAGVPHPVLTAIKNTCTGEHNVILAIGNPDSMTDALHQFCELDHVTAVRVSAYDHPNIVLKKTVIDGAVSTMSINIRRREYGEESNLYRSRVRGIAPEQSVNALIMMKWVLQCWKYHQTYIGHKPDARSFNAAGVDVANSENGDTAGVAWGLSNRLLEIEEFQCPNANHLADNLVKSSEQLRAENKYDYHTKKLSDYHVMASHVGVDTSGLGIATFNQFADLKLNVVSLTGGVDEESIPLDEEDKPLYSFKSFRTQMYYQARVDLQNGDVSIEIIDRRVFWELAKQLVTPRYKNEGGIILEKKEDIKERMGGKSPTLADCFVYWNWVRKNRKHKLKIAGAPLIYAGTEQSTDTPAEPDPRDEIGIWKHESGFTNPDDFKSI